MFVLPNPPSQSSTVFIWNYSTVWLVKVFLVSQHTSFYLSLCGRYTIFEISFDFFSIKSSILKATIWSRHTLRTFLSLLNSFDEFTRVSDEWCRARKKIFFNIGEFWTNRSVFSHEWYKLIYENKSRFSTCNKYKKDRMLRVWFFFFFFWKRANVSVVAWKRVARYFL